MSPTQYRNTRRVTLRLAATAAGLWGAVALSLPALGAELPNGSPAEQVAAIRGQLEAARADYLRKVQQTTSTAERDRLMREVPLPGQYAESMLRVVAQHPNDPAALNALLWVVGNSNDAPQAKAKAILLKDHAESDQLGPLAVALSWSVSAANEDALRQLLTRNKTDRVRAALTYALALQLMAQAEMINWHQLRLEAAPTDEARRQIKETLDKDFGQETAARLRHRTSRVITEETEQLLAHIVSTQQFAAVEWSVDGRAVPLPELAQRHLDALRNLIPGKLAPMTEGTDITGKRLSLADHQGNAVLLIFSGHWCAPCRSLYPLERELSAKHAGRPFTLFGVNSDKSRDLVKKLIESEKTTWPLVWDGGSTKGPLATKWNVKGWPLVVLIDHQGVIRYKFPGAPEPAVLTSLVDRLVDEAEAARRAGQ